MDVDQPNGDFNKSLEDVYDNKYVDSLATEVNNNVVIVSESPGQECIAEVIETHVNAGVDALVEPSAMYMYLDKKRADEDIKAPFSADLNLSLDEDSALQERVREADANDVKDICIDEGLPIKEKIHAEDVFKAPKVIINPHESESKKMDMRDFLKERVVETETLSMRDTAADDSQLKTSALEGCNNEKDTLTETADAGKMGTSQLAYVNDNDERIVLSADLLKLPDAAQMPRRLDPVLKASEHLTASAPLQRDHFDSSFASVGHYAGSVTYSGPIAHSGSLSHRSDASTASTRSFAFPVLKNEWNFSPVRMQKANRRHLRKQRLMHSLFCCKF